LVVLYEAYHDAQSFGHNVNFSIHGIHTSGFGRNLYASIMRFLYASYSSSP
jgi:hypothetical protein